MRCCTTHEKEFVFCAGSEAGVLAPLLNPPRPAPPHGSTPMMDDASATDTDLSINLAVCALIRSAASMLQEFSTAPPQRRPYSAILTVPSSKRRPPSAVFTVPSPQRHPQQHPYSTVLTASLMLQQFSAVPPQCRPYSAISMMLSSQHCLPRAILSALCSQYCPHSSTLTALYSVLFSQHATQS